ncbi:MAG: IPT/TIG domain-containing protein [Acidobacteriota bacterium]|nr:IPT/TIG domain-containing protein [Acidobacteriota bacterium]
MRKRKLTFAIVALVLILAGCKSESPTAPPVTPGGTTPGGGITPPTNPTVRITASNTSPLVNSNVIITATVTENGQNVPNGTAVQFTTTLGTFTDTGSNTSVRITTNGVSTVTLTSAGAGTAHVTATVANVSASVDVTFSTVPVTPQPPSTTPTITTIVPTTGPPAGGTQVTINGTNFRTPVRVLFDIGDGNPQEAFVVSVSPTQIVVITPRINLTTGQTKAADVIVITQAGTAAESRVVKTQGFTYQNAVLTPVIRTVQPTSGPIGGGTRVTIIGDAFQQPVQVFFGSAEAQVLSVTFDQIIVMSPRGSDTAPGGSGVVTGPVPVTVRNVGSNTTGSSPVQFRYTPKMQITTVGPTEGPFTGGTRVRIDGIGFDDPLAVSVAGVAAQVISVSGSEVIVQTVGINLTSCSDKEGPIVVTNTENGDTASGGTFIFRVPRPLITNISNPNNAGGTATITVLNALGFARITIGGVAVPISATVPNANGTTTFTVQLPPTIQLSTVSCPAGGSAPIPTAFDVVYTSATTGCTDTAPKGITINPAAVPVVFANPATFQPFTATITPTPAPAPPFPGTSVTPSATQTIQLVNNGTAPLDIQSITQVGAGCPRFASGPAVPPVVTLNQCESLPISVTYTGQLTPTTETCTLTVQTNAGTKTFLLVGSAR